MNVFRKALLKGKANTLKGIYAKEASYQTISNARHIWRMLKMVFYLLVERDWAGKVVTLNAITDISKDLVAKNTGLPADMFNQGRTPMERLPGIALNYAEMLFVLPLIKAEHERLWRENWAPKLERKEKDIVGYEMKELMKVYRFKIDNDIPTPPEGHCFYLLDRMNRRVFGVEEKIKGETKG